MENKIIQCPSCSKKMQIPPTFFGKKIKCPQCSSVLVIDAQGDVTLGGQPAPPPAPPQKAPAPAPAPVAPAPIAPPQTEAPEASETPAAPEQPEAQAPAPAAPKSMKPKPDLRPKSAVTKPKAQMKQGVKVAGKATKGRLTISKVKKPKRRVSGIKVKTKEKKVGREKLSAVSRFDRKKTSSPLTKLGIGLGAIAIIAAVAYIFLVPPPPPPPDLTPKSVLTESVEFKDQGENEVFDYNEKVGKVHVWDRVIKAKLPYPNVKTGDKQGYLEIEDVTQFVHIPAGEYVVGTNDESGLNKLQSPEIKIKVNDYYISTKEITIEQFRNFSNYIDTLGKWRDALIDEARKFYFQGPEYSRKKLEQAAALDPTIFDHPDQPEGVYHRVDPSWEDDPAVYKISWWSAYAYCAWANRLDPNKGNLPTEIEWEIAARGKEGYLYPWGNKTSDLETNADDDNQKILSKYGYFPGNENPYDPNKRIKADDPRYHVPVRNSFGIYDIAGNVREWCYDPYVTNLYEYLKDINANRAEGEESSADIIYYKGGASQEDIAKYLIAIEDGKIKQRGARLNSGFLSLDNKSAFKFTYRGGVDMNNTGDSLGFRCVYYKDAPAPNAEELKALYDRRKKIIEYQWAKSIASIMLELAEEMNDKELIAQAKKEKTEFETKYKDEIAREQAAAEGNGEANGDQNTQPGDDDNGVDNNEGTPDDENNGDSATKPEDEDDLDPGN